MMNISLSLIRALFLLISTLVGAAYAAASLNGGVTPINILIGVLSGASFAFLVMGIDYFFKQFNLRSFNIAMLGLFIGYLMGKALMLIADSALQLAPSPFEPAAKGLTQTAIFLFTSYFGMCLVARASEEFYMSIPFIKFKPINHKKKDLLIDMSILHDSRILDLAASGLLDHHLILPRFLLKELYNSSEKGEGEAFKARRALDIYKKLENMAHLEMRYTDKDFSDIQDTTLKLNRLARLLDANIITSDATRIQSPAEGISLININTLANALKPISQTGEYINIKIQHPGKGSRQGVGYLDDGTMVVINGGADNLGEIIKAQVVSVKHTTSGRMIFCNSTDEGLLSEQECALSLANLNLAPKSYFTL